jgi:ABC-2 type transport system ATP-binding protein
VTILTDTAMLHCQNVRKAYGSRVILDSLSIDFSEGIYAIKGHNGVGKSTFLRLLSGSDIPDSGKIFIKGIDLNTNPVPAKEQLCYVPDKALIYPFLTGIEFLQFIAKVRKATDLAGVESLIDAFKIHSYLDTRIDDMSFGTKRKFMICSAFIVNTKVILMDEPTVGIDENSRSELLLRLTSWRESHVIVFASHDEQFVRDLQCHRLELNNAQLTLFE